MRRTLTLLICFVFSLALQAQNGRYDLRFANPIVNYNDNTFFFDLEVRANSVGEEFYMSDHSLCFQFDPIAFFSDYALIAQSNISGLVLQDFYQTITLFTTPALSVNGTTVCYDVSLIDGDGFYVPATSWSRIATMTLVIADISQLASLSFNSLTDLPPTTIDEKANGIEMPTSEGFYGNMNSISFSNLPIELSLFEAEVNRDNGVDLVWQTLSESGNESFTVERSRDGQDFKTIGQVAGAGFSTAVLDYKFTDEAPFLGKGYYRLKQTDFDGSFDYSDIVTVFISKDFGEILTIYPNPVKDQLNLNFQQFPGNEMEMQIFNMDGRLLFSQTLSMAEGFIMETSIQVESLPPGSYQVRVTGLGDNGYVAFARFIKL